MSYNVNFPPVSDGRLNGANKFEAFKKSLQTRGELLFTKAQTDEDRTIDAAWFNALVRDGVVSRPVHIRYAIIKGDLNLQYVTFKCAVSITESTFQGEVNFSFTKFHSGINLKASCFEKKADFRAAHTMADFRIPLTSFNDRACFEDIYAEEVFSAEGALFQSAHFMRAHFSKSALFCGALIAGGKLVQTRFRDEVDFSDACFKGPAYFKGACFEKQATFDRIHIESSGFFDCDRLGDRQINHKQHHLVEIEIERDCHELLCPEYHKEVCFIGARVENSLTFAGVNFKGKADFRRIQIGGTAIFDPYPADKSEDEPDIFVPVRFGGDADFWNADIKGAAKFEAVHFNGKANFSHARFGRGAVFSAREHNNNLYPVVFSRQAKFRNADIDGTLMCKGAQFIGDATFARIRIGGAAHFSPFAYNGLLYRVFFNGEVTFIDAYVKSSLNFNGALFNKEVSFERVVTDGSAFFRVADFDEYVQFDKKHPRPPVQKTAPSAQAREQAGVLIPAEFIGKARFIGTRIKSNAEFDGAQFYKEAVFEHLKVGGDIYFRPWEAGAAPAHFFDKAKFIGAEIKGTAEFSGTLFEKYADFTGMQIGGNAYFDSQQHYDADDDLEYWDKQREISPVKFLGDVLFSGAIFRNEVDFRDAQFGKENEEVDSKRDTSKDSTKFKADFTGVRSEGPVYFYGAKFWNDTLFREAKFTSLFFDRPDLMKSGWIKNLIDRFNGSVPSEEKKSQFAASVDLGGCSYERIRVKLEHLRHNMRPVHGNHDDYDTYEEYDRQPYTHLIKALRATGDDRRADAVYLHQRNLERKNIWKRSKSYLEKGHPGKAARGFANYGVDWAVWGLGKYGVQPARLVLISIFVIFIGMGVFMQPNAVIIRSGERDAASGILATLKPTEGSQEIKMRPPTDPTHLEWHEALRVSVSQFIPIVDIPSGSRWKPSEDASFNLLGVKIPFDFYGSLHRLLGAIFVPLIIAALAAALYRRLQKDL
jgi:uncharacterized protein YjbI with pentapeptide repeats